MKNADSWTCGVFDVLILVLTLITLYDKGMLEVSLH